MNGIPTDFSDAEKIDLLWKALDKANAREQSLNSTVQQLKERVQRLESDIIKYRAIVVEKDEQIIATSQLLNEANERAATSVQEFIKNVKE